MCVCVCVCVCVGGRNPPDRVGLDKTFMGRNFGLKVSIEPGHILNCCSALSVCFCLSLSLCLCLSVCLLSSEIQTDSQMPIVGCTAIKSQPEKKKEKNRRRKKK